jgi:hypothetical protein
MKTITITITLTDEQFAELDKQAESRDYEVEGYVEHPLVMSLTDDLPSLDTMCVKTEVK